MAQQTPRGLTYPEPGDHTRLWEHFQTLAEDVDGLVGKPGAFHVSERTSLTFSTNPFLMAWTNFATISQSPSGAWGPGSSGLQLPYNGAYVAGLTVSGLNAGTWARVSCEVLLNGTDRMARQWFDKSQVPTNLVLAVPGWAMLASAGDEIRPYFNVVSGTPGLTISVQMHVHYVGPAK